MSSQNSLPILLSLIAVGSVAMMVLSRPVEAPLVTTPPRAAAAAAPTLEPLAQDYEPLAFEEIYQLPAGPRGLEFTPRAQALKGRKVRLEGFIHRHFHEDAGLFLFAGVPAMHNQAEYMLADSLPVSLVHVRLPVIPGRAPSWRPERLTVLGTLELGSHQELDGRLSHVRVIADHIALGSRLEPVELRRPLALQRDRMASGVRTVFRPEEGASPQTHPTPTPSSSR